jgi:pyruvate dehydrogenase E2 component (dihydrolipoamide acetyltransferase)
MDVEMKMPDLSTTGDEVRVVSWVVEVGGQVTRGAPLLEVETDKATMEVEAIASGVLKRVLVAAGDTVAVGQAIAVIESAEVAPGAREGRPPEEIGRAHV